MAKSDYNGVEIEEEVRQIAAHLGIADFVYKVPPVHKGSGSREVGDALLFANHHGAIIQVKSRQPSSGIDDAVSWLEKEGKRAYRQGKGSRRTIGQAQKSHGYIDAFPVRISEWSDDDRAAAALPLDFDVSLWPIVIVVDHPGADGVAPPVKDAFWITTDDWFKLNSALCSVTGLLLYIERVLSAGEELFVPLGGEMARFRHLAEVDAEYADSGGPYSKPWLSDAALHDPVGARLYRELLERVWPPDASYPHAPLKDLRRILEFLDSTPAEGRVNLGRWILGKRKDLNSGWNRSSGVSLLPQGLLAFTCATANPSVYKDIHHFDADVSSLAAVRADEFNQLGRDIKCSLAIGMLVADDGIDYRYIYTEPPLDASAKIRRSVMHRFGRVDPASEDIVRIQANRNDQCPCGSGLKFKHCDTGNALN